MLFLSYFMDLLDMHYREKKCRLIFFILFSFPISIFAQNTLSGTWEAQSYELTCWRASLANLTKPSWCPENLTENQIDNSIVYKNLPQFIKIAEREFNFRELLNDSVLNYKAINYYLRYDYGRPIIHSYNFDNHNGHFLNIVGCDTLKIAQKANKFWLKIYDPKPNKIGANYLKSFESYKTANKHSLQGTFFNFVDDKYPLPKLLLDANTNKVIDRIPIEKTCPDCISKNDYFLKLTEILKDTLFYKYFGDYSTLTNSNLIKVFDFEEYDKNFAKDIVTLKNPSTTSLILAKSRDEKLLMGIFLKDIEEKYIVERIEDLSKFKAIEKYFYKSEVSYIFAKDGFRFLRFTQNENIQFLDLDNLLKNNKNIKKIFSQKEFDEAIQPHYNKVTESAKLLVNAFQKMIESQVLGVGQVWRYFLTGNMKATEFYLGKKNINEKDSVTFLMAKDVNITPNDNIAFNQTEHYITMQFATKADLDKTFKNLIPSELKPPKIYYLENDSTYQNFQLFFIPIQNYEKQKNLLSKTLDFEQKMNLYSKIALKIGDIQNISEPRLQHIKGFMNSNKFESEYFKYMYSSKGIICDVLIKNKLETCYLLVGNELLGSNWIKWKE